MTPQTEQRKHLCMNWKFFLKMTFFGMEYDKHDLGLPSWPVIEGKRYHLEKKWRRFKWTWVYWARWQSTCFTDDFLVPDAIRPHYWTCPMFFFVWRGGKGNVSFLECTYSVYFEWGSITVTLASFLHRNSFLPSKPNNVLWKTIWDAALADRGPYNGLFNYGLL